MSSFGKSKLGAPGPSFGLASIQGSEMMVVTSTNPAADAKSISAYGNARSTIKGQPLNADELRRMHAYWQACCFMAAGMIYLRENPLLKEPLKVEHIKKRLLGHWGTSPALSFSYIHLNRLIKSLDLDMIFMAGPGHGA